MRSLKPRITVRDNPGGSKSYCVEGGTQRGKRHRRFFATKAEANTYAEQVVFARKNHGAAALALTDKQRVEAVDAFARLNLVGVTLSEAVGFYLRHAQPEGGAKLASAPPRAIQR